MKSIENSYPLSSMQQGMLFHSSLAENSGYYIEQIVCHLHHEVDTTALIQSWQQVVERHSILRTSFSLGNTERSRQLIHDRVQIPFSQQDWQHLTEDTSNKLDRYLQDDRQRGFDLDRSPLMRLALLQQHEADYILVWTFHHALLDGRSMASALQEVFILYDAAVKNRAVTLPQRRPYRDYIDWLQSQSFAKAKTFWQSKLRNFTTPTQLPLSNSQAIALGQSVSGKYSSQTVKLTPELTAALESLAREHQLTLNTLVQGAWALLLHHYTGDSDVVFGATRACRHSSIEGAEEMLGVFINTLPIRTQVSDKTELLPWLQELRSQWIAMRDFEHTPLVEVQAASDVKGGTALFDSVVIFDYGELSETMKSLGGNWSERDCYLQEQTHYPLLLNGYGGTSLKLKLTFDCSKYDKNAIARMLGQLQQLLQNFVAHPRGRVLELPLLTDEEYRQLILDWNDTKAEYAEDLCIHQLFEQQVAKTPEAIAVVCDKEQLSYRQLNERANQLARYLQLQGVEPETLVGIYVERSLSMMVGLLAILKAGGAYLPLDPDFPSERLSLMIRDSQTPLILTQQKLVSALPVTKEIKVLAIDTLWQEIIQQPTANPVCQVTPENLSYVIYTSGSTGKPKGVMVEHRNVVNFFTGMDDALDYQSPGVWLAVTSLSFDISVLELFWTLTRGFEVVIYNAKNERVPGERQSQANEKRAIDFSLFYFSSHEEDTAQKYRLLLEGAKFADANNFKAVWTPERHFDKFGGLFPNSAVTSAALAAITERVQIRAGSCVSPLHKAVRIAEDWSVVDNLSNGRVGISFAAGWQPNDFILQPETFSQRKEIMFQQIAEVQTLWRGESVAYLNGKGDEVQIQTLPRPIQPNLPVWITAAGNPETFREAGARGYNLLTHLLGQSVEELAAKIAIYRQAWKDNNHPGKGTITLMLHTFVGQDNDEVRELVRQPMRQYLASSIGLIAKAAWSFPTFKQKTTNEDGQFSVSHLSQRELDEVLDFSFERYFETSGLFGSVDTCLKAIARLKKTDVDEIACLIDFGVDTETTLAQLPLLNTLRERANRSEPQPDSLADLIKNRRVTHLQCTPSMANLLLADSDTAAALDNIQHLMIGGEAFSESLAARVKQTVSGVIHNMYSPTETTIWSATHRLDPIQSGVVPLGRPIANTELYVLDRQLQPVPLGVAGELFIGGKGVTRGYLNRPELTQERFIPNPFSVNIYHLTFNNSSSPYSLLYKTGDLVRYRPDGSLEFLGRADFQVKVRGYRIELGEIETVLCRHETVKEAVVIVREDVPGDKRLVAYVLPQERPVESLLRKYLGSRLPEYMVPSHIVFLESFPLTPNNKIDRQALPAPMEVTHPQEKSVVATAQTPLEKTLVEIWREVLQVSQLGVDDNFFDLGGNSLIAVSLIGKIRSAFKIELPLLALFQAPTIRSMTARIEDLLVEQSQEASLLDDRTILPRENSDSAPLSFAQERLWFIDQLEPDSSFYNISRAVKLSGTLNIRVLQQALDAIAAHHEILHTNYISKEAKPIQAIAAPRSIELQIIDLQQHRQAERETQIQKILQQESQRSFDLTSDMMLRGCLLQLAPQEQILLLVMHHIASDDWSVGILWEQLTQVYRAFLENKPSPLQPLSIQYADYAVWKRNWLSGEVLEQYLEYWKRQLAGANPVLELPTDRPRPAVKTYRGAHQSLTLSQSLSESLKRLCRQEGVTLYMTLLAAFVAQLHRYVGQEDILIGSPVANRSQTELESLIGLFLNTVVLRVNFSQEPSFHSLLAQVRQVVLDAFAHQDMPFEKLVEELQIERDRSRNPLFQVWFNMLNVKDIELQLPGLDVESVLIEKVASQFDLTLYVAEQDNRIKLTIVYDVELFAPQRIDEMLNQYHYLLGQIVENPHVSIKNLSMVTSEARLLLPNPEKQLSGKWEEAVHSRFTQQAVQVPQHLAVVDERVALTYDQLEEHANQLANYLVANNIQKQDLVAIYAQRDASLVWAILGILKAGAAFVILDPAYPTSRLINCLQLIQPRAWIQITDEVLPAKLQKYVDSLYLNCQLHLDRGFKQVTSDLLQNYGNLAPEVKVEPEHLAYVAFTSGSTGKPKAICGTHRPLSHFIQWHCQTFGLNQADKFGMFSGLSHDPLLRDIFTPLSLGATLYIPQQQDIEIPHKLANWIRQQQISIAHLTPAMGQLLTTDVTVPTKYLRYIFFGGDVLTVQDVNRIRDLAPVATCVNFYGATETPQGMGYFIISDRKDQSDRTLTKANIPIGQGIKDVQLLLLNSKQQLAGIGELAEIHVRTPYLTKGYINNDKLTDEKFMINPFTKISGDRVYKTGDLGRYLPDGNIEFLGRIDNQVKIRGFRVELEEIETVLARHPHVRETVVIARDDISNDCRLVAYVVPQPRQLHSNELRSFLQKNLPHYMIPSVFVFLDTMPLTPNGKIDRKALPVPTISAEDRDSFAPPTEEIELKLTEIWSEVLGIHPIGIKDNFFELGGHSLLAVNLFAQIEKKLDISLPLSILFTAPTVEQLANIIRKSDWTAPWHSLVPIQTEGDKPPLFCVHGGGFNVLIYRELALNLGANQPVYGLQAKGLDRKSTPHSTIEDMAADYVKYIREIQPEGPYFLAGLSNGGTIALEMAQQLHRQDQEVALLAMFDTHGPNALKLLPPLPRLLSTLSYAARYSLPRFTRRYIQEPAKIAFHLLNLSSNYRRLFEKQDSEAKGQLLFVSSNNGENVADCFDKTILKFHRFILNHSPVGFYGQNIHVLPEELQKNNQIHKQARKRYVPQVYSGRITVFQACEQPPGFLVDSQLGWGEIARGGLKIHKIPGHHTSIMSSSQLAKKLGECIAKALATMNN